MARAREIAGLDADAPYASAARVVVKARAEELFAHSKEVLDTADIERLHDMRVASRRLRAAMEVFEPCFPERPFRRMLAEVKELADALGERRDRDVAIDSLERFAAEMPSPDQRGIRTIIDHLKDEQQAANQSLVRFVERERLASLRRGLARMAGRAG